MKTKKEKRSCYMPPESDIMILGAITCVAASNWDNAQIEDDFVDMYDL